MNGAVEFISIIRPKLLMVVDCRAIVAGCLSCWIAALGQELDAVSITDVKTAAGNPMLDRASVIIFSVASADPCQDIWLQDQIAHVRNRRPNVPIVLFAEATGTRLVDSAVRQLHLSGYIPTSSSLELAATALQLVVAGGRYVPQGWGGSGGRARPDTETPPPQTPASLQPSLTPRERSVLDLLERGLPNKLIAYRLGMSPSTVKAHVHNIIAKLRVRNRTEAAVARHAALGSPAPLGSVAISPGGSPTSSACETL